MGAAGDAGGELDGTARPTNIRTTCSEELTEAGRSKNISKTAALFNRSDRFHTPFRLPKCFGSARQVRMQRFLKTVDRYGPWRCVAAATRGTPPPPRSSIIVVDMQTLRISRQSTNHIEPQRGILNHVMYWSQFVPRPRRTPWLRRSFPRS